MSKKNKSGRRGICNLANFTLIVEQKRLIITSDSLSEIILVKETLEKCCPSAVYVVEYFGVELYVKASMGERLRQFKIGSGYSLWQVMK